MNDRPLLKIDNLAVSFPVTRDATRRVRAVNGVSLSIFPQQTLAVVGESGCGKSVSAMASLQLVPTPPGRYESGAIWWTPDPAKPPTDLLKCSDRQMQRIRGGQIAMIFQEPMTSLNPVYTIGDQIREAILLHQHIDRGQATRVAAEALAEVGIAAPESRLKEYPHQLSGGMRQRVMIAMALACKPKLLLADEPTTALDVTIQAQILELLRRIQNEHGMSVLLITHDLGVVAENADAVAVMYAGRVVEYGSVDDVFDNPLHPYTRGLFASMPILGKRHDRLMTIPGNVPNPAHFPTGCPFHPRCIDVNDDTRCSTDEPPLLEVSPRHWAACWHCTGYDHATQSPPSVTHRRSHQTAAPA